MSKDAKLQKKIEMLQRAQEEFMPRYTGEKYLDSIQSGNKALVPFISSCLLETLNKLAIWTTQKGNIKGLKCALEMGADLRVVPYENILNLCNSGTDLASFQLLLEHTAGCKFKSMLPTQAATAQEKWYLMAHTLSSLLAGEAPLNFTETLNLFAGQYTQLEEFAKHFIQNSLARGNSPIHLLHNIQKSNLIAQDAKLDGTPPQFGSSLCKFVWSKIINPLDLSSITLDKLQALSKAVQELGVDATEVAIHGIDVMIEQVITQPKRELYSPYVGACADEDKYDVLKSSLSIILKNASKINFTDLPFTTPSRDGQSPYNLAIFELLKGLECSELAISPHNYESPGIVHAIAPMLGDFIATNKHVLKLDLSNFSPFYLSKMSDSVISGMMTNSRLAVKYSNSMRDDNTPTPEFPKLFEFAKTRAESLKTNYTNGLSQAVDTVASAVPKQYDSKAAQTERMIAEIVGVLRHYGNSITEAMESLYPSDQWIMPLEEVSLAYLLGSSDAPHSNPA